MAAHCPSSCRDCQVHRLTINPSTITKARVGERVRSGRLEDRGTTDGPASCLGPPVPKL